MLQVFELDDLLLYGFKELTFSCEEVKSMAMSSFLLFPLVYFLTLVALQGDCFPHGYVQEYWGDKPSCCLALHFEKNFFCLIQRLKITARLLLSVQKHAGAWGEASFMSSLWLANITLFWTHATTHFCSLLLALFEQQVAAAPLVWGFRREWIYLGEPPHFVSWTGASFCWEARGLDYWCVLVLQGKVLGCHRLGSVGECWTALSLVWVA